MRTIFLLAAALLRPASGAAFVSDDATDSPHAAFQPAAQPKLEIRALTCPTPTTTVTKTNTSTRYSTVTIPTYTTRTASTTKTYVTTSTQVALSTRTVATTITYRSTSTITATTTKAVTTTIKTTSTATATTTISKTASLCPTTTTTCPVCPSASTSATTITTGIVSVSTSTTSISTSTTSLSTSAAPLPLCSPVQDAGFENAAENQIDAALGYYYDASGRPQFKVNDPYPAGGWWTQVTAVGGQGSGVGENGPSYAQSGEKEAVFAGMNEVTISTWQGLPNLNGVYSMSYWYGVWDVYRGPPCTFQVKVGDNVVDSFQVTSDLISRLPNGLAYTQRTIPQTPFLSGTMRLSFNFICPDDLSDSVTYFDTIEMVLQGANPGVNCALSTSGTTPPAGATSVVATSLSTTTTTTTTTSSTTATTTTTSNSNCDVIQNGSFENIPTSDLYQNDVTSGSWTVQGYGSFQSGENNAFSTPYGANFVALYSSQDPATLSQDLTGLVITGGQQQYTLSYNFWLNAGPMMFDRDTCQWTVRYADVTLETYTIHGDNDDIPFGWNQRLLNFVAVADHGSLVFGLVCNSPMSMTSFLVDNVSLRQVGCS